MKARAPLGLAGLLLVAAASSPGAARAADAGVCAPVERQVEGLRAEASALRGEAEQLRARVAAVESQRGQCLSDLGEAGERVAEARSDKQVCQLAKDHQCSSFATYVEEVLRGRRPSTSDLGCLSPDQQRRLGALVAAFERTGVVLDQLAAFSNGETDMPGAPRVQRVPLDKLVPRVVGGPDGAPIAFRRLLVEAMLLVAPQAFRELRDAGPQALEDWFVGTAPLGPKIVAEAERAPGRGPAEGAPLTKALRLAQAYQIVADCGEPGPRRDACGRARQLQQLVETTEPLVVLRRTQDVWATPCGVIGPETLLAWTEDHKPAREGTGGAGAAPGTSEIDDAAWAKLYTCFVDDAAYDGSFRAWMLARMPAAAKLTAAKLARTSALVARVEDGGPEELCARAAHALRSLPTPTRCEALPPARRDAVAAWTTASRSATKDPRTEPTLAVCRDYVRLAWEGRHVTADRPLSHLPQADELVADADKGDTAVARLRELCDARAGSRGAFPADLRSLAELARGLGEAPELAPWRVDGATLEPVEGVRFAKAEKVLAWARHGVRKSSTPCTALELGDARCRECGDLPEDAAYDCALVTALDDSWTRKTHALWLVLGGGLAALAFGAWARRLVRARRELSPWVEEATRLLEGIGLVARPDRLRVVFPGRHELLKIALPAEPAWERWGRTACIVRAPAGARVPERSVNRAAELARRLDANVALLVHDDSASLDLSAVRAMLEWAAKGGSRAVQVMPLSTSRLQWAKGPTDLLDLVEETSLRGNAFEVRGRIQSSTQFFNRERLVSGLLAAAHAGHWQVITGLRRFGKSSLALEVARRLSGPSAYVDLAGFQHEIASAEDAARAADGILRYVCVRLVESARERARGADLPEPPPEGAAMDVSALTTWFSGFARACREGAAQRPPMLVVLDEIEQALAVGPERLGTALEVLAITIGRLKAALGDAASTDAGAAPGVFLASALHPLLWAPLGSLAHQSIMGSFQSVCVPCLSDDAAATMMRSLGSWQGVRFTDGALARLVAASQGVPLLLRRLGASVLELYDPERARQGSLGAVDVGVEGASEAIEREVREGSPLRVWVESEIGDRTSVPGAMLRLLARQERASAAELKALAEGRVRDDFRTTGLDRSLTPEEAARRAAEAASVMLRLLGETGLLVPVGDLTTPDGYELPEGAIRDVLRLQPSVLAKAAPPSA